MNLKIPIVTHRDVPGNSHESLPNLNWFPVRHMHISTQNRDNCPLIWKPAVSIGRLLSLFHLAASCLAEIDRIVCNQE